MTQRRAPVAALFTIVAACVGAGCARMHAPEAFALGVKRIEHQPVATVQRGERPVGESSSPEWARQVRASGEAGVRGICVLLPGILGSYSSPTCENNLRDDGWHVVVIAPPLVSSVLAELKIDDPRGAEGKGARVAQAVDSVVVRVAELARDETARLRAEDPLLAEKPVLVIGESLGALVGVGVVATGRVPCDAALFVAGGGSLLDVARDSSLRRLLFGDLPIDDADFRRGYAEASALDSLAAGARLRDGPIVCVTAEIDRIVPAESQDALWRALGEPPRYRFDGGHLELFLFARWNILPVVRAVATKVGKGAAGQPAGADGLLALDALPSQP